MGANNEIQLMQRIRLAWDRGRLFRNNVGRLMDSGGRYVTFGLCKGSSDLIGYTVVAITPKMIGAKIAVFTAFEVKGPHGRPTQEQRAFVEQIRSDGGIAAIVKRETDVLIECDTWQRCAEQCV
jgi:hypothetical protein